MLNKARKIFIQAWASTIFVVDMLLLARVSSQSLDVGGVHFTTSWYIIYILKKKRKKEIWVIGGYPISRLRQATGLKEDLHWIYKSLTKDDQQQRNSTSKINQVAFLVDVDATQRPWLIQGARKGTSRCGDCVGVE